MNHVAVHSRTSTIKIIIVVAAIALLAILGYKLYSYDQERRAIDTANIPGIPTAPSITTTNDLDTAQTTIDDIKIESSNDDDLAELDSELSAF